MGFKTDDSFLRFLTMGALGVQRTIEQLIDFGFQPIELERYCASNKIWSTKVKRLRLPDLLCVKTGLRVEVRAKTDLKIRMSHAENNPDRFWDSGLRQEDLIAFIACHSNGASVCPAESAMFFSVGDLQSTFNTVKLGPRKSASEGAERDVTWPCTVPSKNGVVLSVDAERIRTLFNTGRKQTYALRGKNSYVSEGDTFIGNESIIAGTVAAPVNPNSRINDTWDPIGLLNSQVDIDRYSASKALPFYESIVRDDKVAALEIALANEVEERVALEMGASLARMDSAMGFDFIINKILHPVEKYIPMEAVFILTELNNDQSLTELERIAAAPEYEGDEIRQAAIWGMGKAGAKAYDRLIQFLDDDEDDVALHAIAGFDANTPNDTIDELIHLLISGSQRQKSAICSVLRLINNDYIITQLVQAHGQHEAGKSWIIAALGQLPPDAVKNVLQGNSLLQQVHPLFHMSKQENWLSSDEKISDLRFLVSQNIS